MSKCLKLFFFINYLFTSKAFADYFGRITFGSFISKEIFFKSEMDRFNDVAILSGRVFLNVDKITSEKYEFNLDIRDKNNFFNKLNLDKTGLTGENKLQLNQFSFLKNNCENCFVYGFGRYPVFEAGSINLDGVNFGYKFNFLSGNLNSNIFYGKNPDITSDTNITFNPNRTEYGIYLNYLKSGNEWGDYLNLTSSYVVLKYLNEKDRIYFYNNSNYQNLDGVSLFSLLYYDLYPIKKIQNFWSQLSQSFSNGNKVTFSLSSIDSLQ